MSPRPLRDPAIQRSSDPAILDTARAALALVDVTGCGTGRYEPGIDPHTQGPLTVEEAPWWHVTNAAGALPAHLRADADAHWQTEGITMRPTGRGCRIRAHGVDLDQLEQDADAACTDLPATPSEPLEHDKGSGSRRDRSR